MLFSSCSGHCWQIYRMLISPILWILKLGSVGTGWSHLSVVTWAGWNGHSILALKGLPICCGLCTGIHVLLLSSHWVNLTNLAVLFITNHMPVNTSYSINCYSPQIHRSARPTFKAIYPSNFKTLFLTILTLMLISWVFQANVPCIRFLVFSDSIPVKIKRYKTFSYHNSND